MERISPGSHHISLSELHTQKQGHCGLFVFSSLMSSNSALLIVVSMGWLVLCRHIQSLLCYSGQGKLQNHPFMLAIKLTSFTTSFCSSSVSSSSQETMRPLSLKISLLKVVAICSYSTVSGVYYSVTSRFVSRLQKQGKIIFRQKIERSINAGS